MKIERIALCISMFAVSIAIVAACYTFQPKDIDTARMCISIAQSHHRGLENVLETDDAAKITQEVADFFANWKSQKCNELIEELVEAIPKEGE